MNGSCIYVYVSNSPLRDPPGCHSVVAGAAMFVFHLGSGKVQKGVGK